jgi:hypothetical protein
MEGDFLDVQILAFLEEQIYRGTTERAWLLLEQDRMSKGSFTVSGRPRSIGFLIFD